MAMGGGGGMGFPPQPGGPIVAQFGPEVQPGQLGLYMAGPDTHGNFIVDRVSETSPARGARQPKSPPKSPPKSRGQ